MGISNTRILPSGPAEWSVEALTPDETWIPIAKGRSQDAAAAVLKAVEAAGRWVNQKLDCGRTGGDPTGFYSAMYEHDADRAGMGWNPAKLPFGEIFQEGSAFYSQAVMPGSWALLMRIY